MTERKEYSKKNPHKDIGKQKFRVRKAYTAWVEYDVVADSKDEAIDAVIEQGGIEKIEWQEGYHNDEPVEVYCQDYNSDATDSFEAVKVAEDGRTANEAKQIVEARFPGARVVFAEGF